MKKRDQEIWVANSWGGRKRSLESIKNPHRLSPRYRIATLIFFILFYGFWASVILLIDAAIYLKIILLILVLTIFFLSLRTWIFRKNP